MKVSKEVSEIIYSKDYTVSLSEKAIELRWKPQDQVLEKLKNAKDIPFNKGANDFQKLKNLPISFVTLKTQVLTEEINNIAIKGISLEGSKNKCNQDRFGASSFKIKNKTFTGDATCIILMDGFNGTGFVEFALPRLHSDFEKEFQESDKEHEEHLYNGFKRVVTRLQRDWFDKLLKENNLDESGSTLCAHLIIQRDKCVEIWNANVGDSRGMVIHNSKENPRLNFIQTSVDASIDETKFHNSVANWGGVIKNGQLGPLKMLRALGAVTWNICPRPKITRLVLNKDELDTRQIIVAAMTDGLTDVFGTRKIGSELGLGSVGEDQLALSARELGVKQDDVTLVTASFKL